jgi:hypothetical protein
VAEERNENIRKFAVKQIKLDVHLAATSLAAKLVPQRVREKKRLMPDFC